MKKFAIRIVVVLMSLIAFNTTYAQVLNHRLGQFLVKTSHPIERVIQSHQDFEGVRTDLKLVKPIGLDFNIYLLEFDYGNIHEEKFLRALKNHPMVEVAQYNHILSNRAVPNDTQFDDQWQYINTGQSGGTTGADIDMDLAWDIATGGVTALGDTIVAAIIDDGFDFSHEDFGDNLWVNHDEIPNDGIDNDNDGYVDDYIGWNAYSNDDNITGGGHGTPVTGIVGAQGNNGIGVAGVNWDVKLMIIQGGGDEADALAAYAYCFAQRKKYNETGGQEGAYVVTTNSSWGVDFGQPADAPLWCSFYDTLGVQGIVSCGATINGNENVDMVGDLPTACGSDYLISVTNMNDNDQKVSGAGYGATTIDLGAFGADTWTTAFNNSYGGFGGTSGATPHVAGTVALMHSVPCPSFAAFAKNDPAAAALLIKQYILDGVDPNMTLDGITVTGGRLNVANAMTPLVSNCDPNGCFIPYSVTNSATTDVQTEISWNVGNETTQSDLRYRIQGETTWTEVPNVTSPYVLGGLVACNTYEYELLSICGSDSTSWTNTFLFDTDGCCEPPSVINASNITDSDATITWSSVLAALSYDIRYKAVSDAMWTEMNQTATTAMLTNLAACTSYEVQIRTNCDGGVATGYSDSYIFSTSGCGPCIDNEYCESAGADSDFEWIERVEFNTIDNTSGNDDGYGNHTDYSTNIETGMSYDITVTPGFFDYPYNEYVMVYIDYNQDGDFDDDNELAFDPGESSQDPITGTITVPTDAMEGPTRMRVSQRWNEPAAPCEEAFDYGEVEDYCVNVIVNVVPTCDVPTNITFSNTLETSTDVDWEDMPNAIGYELRYRIMGTVDWDGSVVSVSNATLTDLTECEDYELEIKTVCGSNISDFSNTNSFETMCSSSTNNINELSFSIRPNPVANQLHIQLEDGIQWTANIMDVSGKVLRSEISNHSQHTISVSDLPSGIYFVQINQDGKTGIQKVVKL